MANAALLHANLADAGTVSADTANSSMPASNVQNVHVARRWRSTISAGSGTGYILCDLGSSQSIDTIALLGMTMTSAGTVRLRVSTADATGAAGDALDTGTLASPSTYFDTNYGALVWAGAAAITGRYVRIDLVDTGLHYVEAGRLVVGARTEFTYNFVPGSSRGRIDLSRKTRTEGGQTLTQRRAIARTLELNFDWITVAQWASLIEPTDRDAGLVDDVLIVIDPSSTNVARDSIWGQMTELSSVPFTAVPDVYSKSYRIEERL